VIRAVRFEYAADEVDPHDVLVRIDTVTDAGRADLAPYWMRRSTPGRYHLDIALDERCTVLYQFHVSRGRRADIERGAASDRDVWRAVLDECIADPANPAQVPDAWGRAPSSVLDLGGDAGRCLRWPPRPASGGDASTPCEEVVLPGDVPRRVWLTSSPDPEALVIVFDGDVWTRTWPLRPLLDAEIAAGRLPPLAVVLVDPGDRRSVDLAASDDVARFVAGLVDWASARLGTRFPPERVIACGQSLGGLAAAHAALAHPDKIGNVLSQSGSFWYPDPASTGPDGAIQDDVRTGPRRPVRFHLQVGAMESLLREPNHGLHRALTERGYDSRLTTFGGGHGYPWWYLHLPAGLAGLLER